MYVSHRDRAARRAEAARRVLSGESPHHVAASLGLSSEWVQKCCRENAVDPNSNLPGLSSRGDRTLRVIAAILQTNRTYMDIAGDQGCTKQYVHYVAGRLKKAGVSLPERPHGGYYHKKKEAQANGTTTDE